MLGWIAGELPKSIPLQIYRLMISAPKFKVAALAFSSFPASVKTCRSWANTSENEKQETISKTIINGNLILICYDS
jgi:hypothetical protein